MIIHEDDIEAIARHRWALRDTNWLKISGMLVMAAILLYFVSITANSDTTSYTFILSMIGIVAIFTWFVYKNSQTCENEDDFVDNFIDQVYAEGIDLHWDIDPDEFQWHELQQDKGSGGD